jgi:hypothetical protein
MTTIHRRPPAPELTADDLIDLADMNADTVDPEVVREANDVIEGLPDDDRIYEHGDRVNVGDAPLRATLLLQESSGKIATAAARAGTTVAEGGPDNHKLVRVYDCVGRPWDVQKAKYLYYLRKPCPVHNGEHRAFYPRQLRKPPEPKFRCPSSWVSCNKRFYTEAARDDHFRKRHAQEAVATERERQLRVEMLQAESARAQAELLKLLAAKMGLITTEVGVAPVARVDTREDEQAAAEEGFTEEQAFVTRPITEVIRDATFPSDDWLKRDIIAWARQRGIDVGYREVWNKPRIIAWLKKKIWENDINGIEQRSEEAPAWDGGEVRDAEEGAGEEGG